MPADIPANGQGFTIKEVLLDIRKTVGDLDRKLETYIELHQREHTTDRDHDSEVRGNPKASGVGRQLLDDIEAVAEDGRETRTIVNRHDVLIQRLIGATTLASFLGLGAVGIVLLRVSGIVP